LLGTMQTHMQPKAAQQHQPRRKHFLLPPTCSQLDQLCRSAMHTTGQARNILHAERRSTAHLLPA
jgi:hypothetical protein